MTAVRQTVRLEADWLIPVATPPVRGGAVLVDGAGKVVAVGPSADVPKPPAVPRVHWANAVLLPGLVNAHTHLELTGLAGRVEESEFPRWIRGVRELKAGLDDRWFRAAARQGIREAWAAGITTVLDTGDSGSVLEALAELGGSGVVYQEVFGPDPAQVDESMAGLAAKIDRQQGFVTDRASLGVSPHAPYTVSGPLYRQTAELARTRGLKLAVHLAESPEESAFVQRGTGPFADAWRGRGIPPLEQHLPNRPDARRSPVAWLDAHGVLGPNTLAIHAVELDDQDIVTLAKRGVAVAHCPASNARHHRTRARLRDLLGSGVKVGLGTDSVVSVGRLDLFEEMRLARQIGGLSADRALALATLEAARLAGLEANVGWLGPGAFGDVTILAMSGRDDPLEAISAGSPDQVLATYLAGRPVYRRDHGLA